MIASYGEYSENLATEPKLVRKSLDNNKPKVNASPHGMVLDLKLSHKRISVAPNHVRPDNIGTLCGEDYPVWPQEQA